MKKAKNQNSDLASWLHMTLDVLAQEKYGEFGYTTCTCDQQKEIIIEMVERNLVAFPNE
jgi:hypothetical protein